MADITFTISSHNPPKQANGTLEWPAKNLTISGVSGPHGNGFLPAGEYTAKRSKLLDKNEPAYVDNQGKGWMQVLEPNFTTPRTDLGIHPDGNVAGTEGCIGIQPDDTKAWYDAFYAVVGSVTVKVIDNAGG